MLDQPALDFAHATGRRPHVAIIMDGNSRWAERRGLSRASGHLAGHRNVLRVIEAASSLPIGQLTLFAFSTENWGREDPEVRSLMSIFTSFFSHDVPALACSGIRTRALGRLEDLPADLRTAISDAAASGPAEPRLDVIIALAYGGRAEIADAARRAYAAGDFAALNGDADALARYLYAPELPPPDIIVRTGGRRRLSNFMLWQAAYSEIRFSDVLWPDFGPADLQQALDDLAQGERTYGVAHTGTLAPRDVRAPASRA